MTIHDSGQISFEHNRLLADDNPDSFQWWYFDAEFIQGYSAVLVILPNSIGILEGHEMDASMPVAWINITTPEGMSEVARKVYQHSDLIVGSHQLDVSLGSNRIRYDGNNYQLEFAEGDLSAELVLTPVLPPWSPLGAYTQLDSETIDSLGMDPGVLFDYVAFVPRGTIEGVIRIGGDTISVKGLGYHEQGYGNSPLGKIFDTWFWTKYYLDEYTLVIAGGMMNKNFGGINRYALMLAKDDQIITSGLDILGTMIDYEIIETTKISQRAEPIPAKLKLNAEMGGALVAAEISYNHMRDLMFYSYQPGSHTPDKEPHWLQYLTDIDVEITFNGERISKIGKGVYEIMVSG